MFIGKHLYEKNSNTMETIDTIKINEIKSTFGVVAKYYIPLISGQMV